MHEFASHAERAYSLFQKREIAAALEQFLLSAQAGEDQDQAALERWLTFMIAGEFELAWQESDRVLRVRQVSGVTCGHLPEYQRWLWDGSPLAGRRVQVRCFHGLGDTLQYVRLLPRLRSVCREVGIVPQPELHALIPPEPLDDPELEIELMEVPHALRLTVASIPATVPYLAADLPPGRSSRFRLGLAWASGEWRPERSIPLETFGFLNDLPDLELVGLQRGPAAYNRPQGSPDFDEADWANLSIPDTARTIRGLDLVITTDTMVAHLAGALAVPVWTMLPWDADWRWMAERNDSPWYPTMRLFRQVEPGRWDHVTAEIQRALRNQEQKIAHNQPRAGQDANKEQAPENVFLSHA